MFVDPKHSKNCQLWACHSCRSSATLQDQEKIDQWDHHPHELESEQASTSHCLPWLLISFPQESFMHSSWGRCFEKGTLDPRLKKVFVVQFLPGNELKMSWTCVCVCLLDVDQKRCHIFSESPSMFEMKSYRKSSQRIGRDFGNRSIFVPRIAHSDSVQDGVHQPPLAYHAACSDFAIESEAQRRNRNSGLWSVWSITLVWAKCRSKKNT